MLTAAKKGGFYLIPISPPPQSSLFTVCWLYNIDLETVVAHDKSHTKAEEALQSVKAALEAGTKLGNHTISPDVVAPSAPATTSEGTATTTATGNTATDGSNAPPAVGTSSITEPAVPAPHIPELDFSYPQYDDEALEMDSLSNTSDCNHRGNGVPCRFYNREGCAKGTLCPFSHAPDEKSVRDDLYVSAPPATLLFRFVFANDAMFVPFLLRFLIPSPFVSITVNITITTAITTDNHPPQWQERMHLLPPRNVQIRYQQMRLLSLSPVPPHQKGRVVDE
jgi:hypothetical protein